ncbi:DUF6497 family protein [Paracoccus luteus]|uniref:DUF6497 family protein n=1 Tax=Paracoccus luteus TaxID=2508543 RepID=UPI00106F4162|nr:DUF6497 family protein [Paracoccus luteus]
MTHPAAALICAFLAAGTAAAVTPARIPVPSGAEVWRQEVLTDRVPGMGLVQRYRYVMPALADLVPPIPEEDLMDNLPADMIDIPPDQPEQPLTPAEQAELDAALAELSAGGLMIEGVPADDAAPDQGPVAPDGGMAAMPELDLGALSGDDGGAMDGPLPSELAPPDAADPSAAPVDGDVESAGDLAAIQGDIALPAAPEALMQDPVHKDIVHLCNHDALPDAVRQSPRPTQIVISVASAPSEFGSFDPAVVQLFEGFSLPADRDACVWEAM